MNLGILGPSDHEIFREVGRILQHRGISTDFLEYEEELEEELEPYNAILTKKSREEAFQTLKNAERRDIQTVNGFRTHMKTAHNPASYWHASEAGIKVPKWSTNGSFEEENIVKPRLETSRLDPYIQNGEERSSDSFYQEFIENSGTDLKIYVVNGRENKMFGVKTPSKIQQKGSRKPFQPDREMREIAEKAAETFNARLLGIDLVENSGEYFAVDFNSAPSYRGTDAEEAIADNIEQLLEE